MTCVSRFSHVSDCPAATCLCVCKFISGLHFNGAQQKPSSASTPLHGGNDDTIVTPTRAGLTASLLLCLQVAEKLLYDLTSARPHNPKCLNLMTFCLEEAAEGAQALNCGH